MPAQPDLPIRLRRLRASDARRALVRETQLHPSDFIQPLFVTEPGGQPEPIEALPGQYRWPLDHLGEPCQRALAAGVPAVALFPNIQPAHKSADGRHALESEQLGLRAIRKTRAETPELDVIADVALDPFTTHGHDGLLNAQGTEVLNDETVAVLAQMAVLQAEAGATFVAPSDMMDGRVGAIRQALDAAGFNQTAIMAYAAKFSSAYYGPFRQAVGSAQAAGTTLLNKDTYQLDPANRRQARREALLDAREGADLLMVKPAGPYLDIIRDLREATDLPLAAYQVSGEYAQLQAAARMGWLDLERCRDESLLAIKRAGADCILTYFATEAAEAFSQDG